MLETQRLDNAEIECKTTQDKKVRKLEPPACWTGQPNAMQRLNATKKHEDKKKPLTKNKNKLENV